MFKIHWPDIEKMMIDRHEHCEKLLYSSIISNPLGIPNWIWWIQICLYCSKFGLFYRVACEDYQLILGVLLSFTSHPWLRKIWDHSQALKVRFITVWPNLRVAGIMPNFVPKKDFLSFLQFHPLTFLTLTEPVPFQHLSPVSSLQAQLVGWTPAG